MKGSFGAPSYCMQCAQLLFASLLFGFCPLFGLCMYMVTSRQLHAEQLMSHYFLCVCIRTFVVSKAVLLLDSILNIAGATPACRHA